MIFWCLRKNGYKCCSVYSICFVKDKTYFAECENAVPDLLSQFVIPTKSDCQWQYDSHSCLLSRFSCLVNISGLFWTKRIMCSWNIPVLFLHPCSSRKWQVLVLSLIFFLCDAFPPAALELVTQSYPFVLKWKGREKIIVAPMIMGGMCSLVTDSQTQMS